MKWSITVYNYPLSQSNWGFGWIKHSSSQSQADLLLCVHCQIGDFRESGLRIISIRDIVHDVLKDGIMSRYFFHHRLFFYCGTL